MNELVSVIIPMYNAANSIEGCVSSVINQTYKNIEIIIVDDGSTDSSPELCNKLKTKDARITVYHNSNSGVSASRNFGISKASGDYICFIDSDDYMHEDLIEDSLERAFKSNADVVVYGFTYCTVDTSEREDSIIDEFAGTSADFFNNCFNKVVESELLNAPWNKLIKRSFLVNGKISFDTRYSICEDIIFSIDLFSQADRISVLPKSYYDYTLQKSQSLRSNFHNNFFEAIRETYRKGIIYCNQFENNDSQKAALSLMFVSRVIAYIKRVIRTDQLSVSKKTELLNTICLDDSLNDAISKAHFTGSKFNCLKKKIVCRAIRANNHKMLKTIYKFSS